MPINYSKYPKDWAEIRARILKRAKNKCEFCGVKNYTIGYWVDTKFISVEKGLRVLEKTGVDMFRTIPPDKKPVKVVLTIAHLDHDEENHNVKDDRLVSLCQRCHLIYDISEKRKRRFEKKHKSQLKLI